MTKRKQLSDSRPVCLTSPATPPSVVISPTDVAKGPVILKTSDGQPYAVAISWAEYQRLFPQKEPATAEKPSADFEAERAAFYRLKNDLLKTHPGLFVAIVGGKVVESGPTFVEVARRVYDRLGYVPMYVQLVADDLPECEFSSPEDMACAGV